MADGKPSSDSFAALFETATGENRERRRIVIGDAVEARVVTIGHNAVFADIGGRGEGLFERNELEDDTGVLRIEVGSVISATVTGWDKGSRLAKLTPLAIRAAGEDAKAARVLTGQNEGPSTVLVEGARVRGKVTGVERFGVFLQIDGTTGRSGRGLIPAQETGTARNADLSKTFSIGQQLEAKILRIEDDGKIRLSIKALGADDERGLYEAYRAGQEPGAAPTAEKGGAKKPAAPRNFGTLADLLGGVKVKAPAAAPAAAPARKR